MVTLIYCGTNMNERIRELKEQAWEYAMAVHDGLIVPPLDKEVWPVDKVFDEKFAELIVRECAEVASKVVVEHEGVDFGLVEKCYEHFGVDE
jgi:hypothetical protein